MSTVGQAGYAVLHSTGLLAAWRACAPGPVVMAYHNVIPAGEMPRGESSLHLLVDRFATQMRWLAARFRMVPLGEIAMALATGPARQRLAAVTFDDAYRGVLSHGIPVLKQLGIPATIFVVESAPETLGPFWWDALAEARPSLDRKALREAWGGNGSAIFGATGVDPDSIRLPEEYLPANWEMLRRAQSPLVDIGAHSRTHPMLTTLSPQALNDELRGARDLIGKHLDSAPEGLAYPYGDWNEGVVVAAAQAGYRYAVTTDRRWVASPRDPLRLPRQTISSGMTLPAFAAAASGFRWSR